MRTKEIFIGGTQTGGIVANCDFGNVVVSNCRNYGDVNANNANIGGIVGGMFQTNEGNSTTITNCQNNGEIGEYINDSNIAQIGGIVGRTIGGSIDNCVNNGQVNGYCLVGGISGRNSQTPIEYCRNYGKVIVFDNRGGGIVGINESSTIMKCLNDGMIYLGEEGFFGIGGIAGASGAAGSVSVIEECFNSGEVYSLSTNPQGQQSGGIVGNISSSTYSAEVKNCYNTGFIHGIGQIGGIIGWGKDVIVQNCYNVGKLETEPGYTNYLGGIVAAMGFESTSHTIDNNYWLNTCGATYGYNRGQSNEGAEGKSMDELQGLTNALGEAYKEDNKNINDGYPILSWQ